MLITLKTNYEGNHYRCFSLIFYKFVVQFFLPPHEFRVVLVKIKGQDEPLRLLVLAEKIKPNKFQIHIKRDVRRQVSKDSFRFKIPIQVERTGFPCECVTPFLALHFLGGRMGALQGSKNLFIINLLFTDTV